MTYYSKFAIHLSLFFLLQKTLSYNNASIDLVIESRKTLSSRSFVSLLDQRKLFFKTNLFIYKLSSLTDFRFHSSPSFRDWRKTRKILSKEIVQKPPLSNNWQHIYKPIIYLLDQGKAVFWIQHVLKLSVTFWGLLYDVKSFPFYNTFSSSYIIGTNEGVYTSLYYGAMCMKE